MNVEVRSSLESLSQKLTSLLASEVDLESFQVLLSSDSREVVSLVVALVNVIG
jgi:hypothetical protein